MGVTINRIIVKIFSWFYIIASIVWLWCLVGLSMSFQLSSMDIAVEFVIICILFVSTYSIGFSGLYALKKKDGGKMKMFGVIVIILSTMQTLILITLLVFLCISIYFVDKVLNNWMESYNMDSESSATIDRIQSILQCCGRHDYNDWGPLIPVSCCADFPICVSFYRLGCTEVMDHIALTYTLSVALPLIGVIAFHILTAKLSFKLARVFKEPGRYVNPFAQKFKLQSFPDLKAGTRK